jgi:hypothetical protein
VALTRVEQLIVERRVLALRGQLRELAGRLDQLSVEAGTEDDAVTSRGRVA